MWLKINHISTIVVSVSVLMSCNSKNQVNVRDAETLKKSISIVSAQNDSAVKYAVFTPQLSENKPLPVIILFDPHNQGTLPVERYAPLAEKYGYLLVGSLNLRNGQSGDQMQYFFNATFQDVTNRFHIDQKQIYLSGFSGGAKVAMMFGLQMPQISGVIACGGSIDPQGFTRKGFCFVGMVGNRDFNYLDMLQTFSGFSRNEQPFISIVFNGKHEWPPVNDYEKAFISLEMNAMKNHTKPTDKATVNIIKEQVLTESNMLESEGHFLKAYENLVRAQAWFDQLADDKKIDKKTAQLEIDPRLKKELTKMQSMAQKEAELRSQFVQSIEKQDLTWWKTEVSKIKQNTETKEEQIALTSSRILNYLSMASFMLVNADLLNQNADGAFKKIQIYELVDPDNPDVYLMFARYYLLKGKRDLMLDYVHKAVDKGFTNWQQYREDPNFSLLFNQPEILDMSY